MRDWDLFKTTKLIIPVTEYAFKTPDNGKLSRIKN